jgi:uncharacterized membrane protein
MKRTWSALSPMRKTVVVCGTVELLIFFALLLITNSALAALCCALSIGPASIWLAPLLLRQFRTVGTRLGH